MQAGRQRGLTLIELMVAMVIGLFLIGGVIGVFVANQQTSNTKQQLDRAQENFRFGSQTLMRVMRQGTGIDPASTSTELIVDFAGGPGTHDCIGTTAGGPNRFRVDDQGRLVCADSGNADHVLMGEVAALNVSFGIDADDNGLIGNDEYVAHTDVADWTQVASVRAALTLTNGQQLPFTATMRPVIVAAPSASSIEENPSVGEDSAESETEDIADNDAGNSGGDGESGGSGDTGDGTGEIDAGDEESETVACNCHYQNHVHGYSVQGGSNAQCTPACCQANDTGTGNNRYFAIDVPSC